MERTWDKTPKQCNICNKWYKGFAGLLIHLASSWPLGNPHIEYRKKIRKY